MKLKRYKKVVKAEQIKVVMSEICVTCFGDTEINNKWDSGTLYAEFKHENRGTLRTHNIK